MELFLNNIGTIIISAVLIMIVVCIIVHLRKEKAAGKSSCGCNCSGCAMKGSCHSKK